ncbi:MAG TPA: flagellar motor switch protein FliN [Acidimicrobiales bacterium]|nr:flagellar motor switch protein FliN [Acidimicrobiales bacterium]
MSVETDQVVIGPAAVEAATLLSEALGLGATLGESFDFWGQDGGDLSDIVLGEDAWSAPLLGPLGPCGEIALALSAGTSVPVPGKGKVSSAFAACAAALTAATGADHVGDTDRAEAAALAEPRPGQRALAVPLKAGDQRAGVLVVISSASQPAAELPHLDPSPGPPAGPRSIAALGEVEMTVSVELGRTKLPIRELLNIHSGAVVQLDRTVTHPVDIFVQGSLIARGEVVVVDECFAVRVTELLAGD